MKYIVGSYTPMEEGDRVRDFPLNFDDVKVRAPDAVLKISQTVNDGTPGKRLPGIALVAGGCFVGYKVLTSGRK